MSSLNPYDPPGQRFANGSTLAGKYVADYSRLGLGEFRRVCGSPVRGAIEWFAIKLQLKHWVTQVFDAPVPMLSQLCRIIDTPQEFHDDLIAFKADAARYGYAGELCTVNRSEGVAVTTVGLRMLHESKQSFLTSLFAKTEDLSQNETQVTSVYDMGDDFTTLSVTNEPLRFAPSTRCVAEYLVGASLAQLCERHAILVAAASDVPSLLESPEDIAVVVDTLTVEFYDRMILSGVFSPA
ncbi:hypothetical protein [Novipirellula rosea]|uniref:Uncharacterized protein n=1 Tax=Novipirellula rosea TaxID=1031540 RepID=A0ABP8N9A6_9BACT|tara:strand:- start:7516 stop:8232 length:717 start_codon:yes stop_codon:yes gene_type:complete